MAANGGSGNVYPYLTAIFPNGIQAVSGVAYKDAGSTVLASTTAGAGLVSLLVGSSAQGTVSTGANGYYYFALPAGTISSGGSPVLAYTVANNNTGAKNAATLATETGSTTGFNIDGGDLLFTTSALLYSTALSTVSAAEAVATAGGTSASVFSGLTPFITATGASFTLDQALTPAGSLSVQTTATNAPLTVAQPLTLAGANTLTLNASGALAINAPITVSGAGAVALSYNTALPTNLTFALGSSINYGATNNGGSLNINGQGYTLLYKLTDSGNATGNGTDTGTDDIAGIDHAGDSGYYALATSLTGSGSASAAQFSHPLAGSGSHSFNGVFEGLGNTITGLTINDSADELVGLFGTIAHGTVRDLGMIGGSVTGTNHNGGNPYSASGAVVGALVGLNGNGAGGSTSWVINDYAGTIVATPSGGIAGGLVGYNNGYNANATIINSFATGAVTATGGQSDVGGLAGYNFGNNGTGLITQSYATGPVYSAGDSSNVGGLLGINNSYGGTATVTDSYATGAVSISGSSRPGGIAGYGGGTTSTLYWDSSTSGQSNAAGAASVNATGYGTAALQSTSTTGVTLTGFSGGAAGGQNGVYPYLTSFFPNGVQAVSGYAYNGIGSAPLASSAAGAVPVSLYVGGAFEGAASTGANGYYYLALPSGTLPTSPATAIAYATAPSSAQDGATLGTASLSGATGTVAGPNIYAGYLNFTTSATSYSTATSSMTTAQTAVNALAGTGFASSLAPYINATGASFTVDQSPGTNGLAVQTTANNAPITVAAPITVSGSNGLLLNASGALAIDAPITVSGAGSVALGYNTASSTNLTFAIGSSINYGATNNGGTLSINGQAYTLLYKLTDSVASTGNGPDGGTDDIAGIDGNTGAGGDNGYYALATNVTGTGSAAAAQFSHPLAGSGSNSFNGVFEGLGHTITGLTLTDSADVEVGLFGTNLGTVRDIGLIGGSVSSSASSTFVGDLLGQNIGSGAGMALVVNAYASGSVSGAGNGAIGGLVGGNYGGSNGGTVENSFATGAVSGGSYANIGGLVGYNTRSIGAATVQNTYASGAVTGGFQSDVGGLVGGNHAGSVQYGHAIGAVSGGSYVGGVIGYNQSAGVVSAAYWDTTTSGTSTGSGGGGGSVQGLTTSALQSSATSGVTLSSAFAGGAVATANGGTNGVYPYLASFFPNGVQAISGLAYTGIGGTALASGTSGAVLVGVTIGGVSEGTVSTGANGYYYVVMPPNTLTSTPSTVVAYSTAPTSSQDGGALTSASLSTATGAVVGPTIYGSYLNFQTAATTYSSASSAFAAAQTAVDAAAGMGFSSAFSPFITATGASFTIDQTPSSATGFAVQTTATNAPITVAAPITIAGSNTLSLNAAGTLAINAPVSVTGAGSVALGYNTSSPTNLTFALGDSINYGATNNGGSLSINGHTYTLLYKLTDSSAATGNGTDNGTDDIAGIDQNTAAGGDNGYFALATNVTGTGSASAPQFAHPLAGSGANRFNGVFEGLGNRVTNLTVSDSTDTAVGLFGQVGGTIRDLGLIGGSVTGGSETGSLAGEAYSTTGASVLIANAYGTVDVTGAGTYTGGLVGLVLAQSCSVTIENSFAGGAVRNGAYTYGGGLVGYNYSQSGTATILNSYATGAVSGPAYSYEGGLVGGNNNFNQVGGSVISNSYATGAVSGGYVGGLVADENGGSESNAYWDITTSGTSNGSALGTSVGTGYATTALQSTATTGVALGSAFAGGAAGVQNSVYPYLVGFFPNGVQAISGYAYNGAGSTPLASGGSGAVRVSWNVGGVSEGSAFTGANGYYYLALPASTLPSSPATLIAYATAPSSAQNGATLSTASLSTATGTVAGPTIYGGYLNFSTSATLYSTALTAFSTAQSTVAGVTGSSFESSLAPYITATGANFTFDQALSGLGSSLAVQTTTTAAPITIAQPITLSGTNALILSAAGALRFNAPVTVTGAGTVSLAYSTTTAQNLGFGIGDGLTFTGTNSNGTAQGTLSINGTGYTLVNSMSELDAIDATSAVNGSGVTMYGSGLGGAYALATPVNASGTTYTTALVGTNSDGTSATQFSGAFEGLGNTITGLTINSAANNVGLFGFIGGGGVVRDLGLVGGSVTGTASYTVTPSLQYGTGSLAGENGGLITQSYSTAAVNGTNNSGGFVGRNDGTVSYAFATGAVSAANSSADVGGLIGINVGPVRDAYAMGAVTTGANSIDVGGFVGIAQGPPSNSISYAYSTGVVSAISLANNLTLSGFYGATRLSGGQNPTMTQAYWDSTTSNLAANAYHAQATSLSTSQLQGTASLGGTTVSLAGFSGGAAGGTSGIYPYLTNFYPNGVQSIAGVAYKDAGATVLASGTAGAGVVSIASGGSLLATADTGFNGYYYSAVPAGSLAANQWVAAFTQANGSTGALAAAQFTQSSGGTSSTIPVYGGWMLQRAGTITSLSALNAAYATAVGSTAGASLAPANRQITGSGAFGIDTSLSASGTVSLQFTGAVTESGGAALSAANLLLAGSGGSFTLNDTNTIGTLAAATGSVSLVDGASLTTGSLNDAAGTVTSGVTTTGTLSLVSGGGITLAAGDGVSGQSPVLAASGAFTNNAGANGVTATSGNWLIYSSAPGADTFGALNSNDTAIFGVTYSTLAPGAVTQSGNRYLFANQPLLTVSPTSDTKAYGVDDGASIVGDYSITGFAGVSGVFIADTASNAVSGSATVTSAGSGAYAPVSGSPYAMSAALGTLSSTGYTFQTASGGTLTITPATLTVAGATGVNKTYDGGTAMVNGAAGFTTSGLFAHDTGNVSVTAAGDVYDGAAVGLHNIDVTGLSLSGTAAGNYSLSATTATGSGTIASAVINLSGARPYDATMAANASVFGSGGTVSGVAGQLLTLTGSGTLAAKTVGNEAVTALGTLALGNGGSGGTAGLASNYTLVGGTDSVNVTPLGITVAATASNKTYDATPAATVSLASSGVLSNDVVTFADTSATFDTANAGTGKTVTVSGLTLGGADGGNYSVSNANTTATTTANIAPVVINLSGARAYDATTAANASVFGSGGTVGGVAGQLLTVNGRGTLAAKTVGNEAVTALGTLALGNGGSGGTAGLASNYTLVGGTDSVNVTPLGITVAATASNKTYDATPAATVSLASSGVLSNDVVTFADASATFDTANAGTGKTVTVTGLSLGGADSGNYLLGNANATATTTANITPATITVAGATGVNKTYDGTTALPSGATGFTSGGVFAIDAGAITVAAANAAYASAAAGTEAVNVSGLSLSGAAAGNYVLSASNVTGSGTIAAASSGSGSGSAGGSGGGGSSGSGGGGGTSGGTSGGASGGSGSGSGSSGSGGSAGTGGGASSGGFTLPALTGGGSGSAGGAGVSSGSGGAASAVFVLSGTPVSSVTNGNGTTTTVVGSIRNGVVTLQGTFIVQPRSAAGSGSLPYEIAASADYIVTYVPGTLSAQLFNGGGTGGGDTGNGFASMAVAAVPNVGDLPSDSSSLVFMSADDPTRPWEAVDTLGNPGFDQTVVCVKGHCAVVAQTAGNGVGYKAAVVSRGR
jgi:hypothetical protein